MLDFGVARLVPQPASGEEAVTLAYRTSPGTLLGTLAYMSPEQAHGLHVGPATDIFALGVVFYELVTGRHPFKADSMIDILNAIISLRPALPFRRQCPAEGLHPTAATIILCQNPALRSFLACR